MANGVIAFHYKQDYGNAFYLDDGKYLGISDYSDSGPLLLENLNTLRILKEHYPDRGFIVDRLLVSSLLEEVKSWIQKTEKEVLAPDVRKNHFNSVSGLVSQLLLSPQLSNEEMLRIRSDLIAHSVKDLRRSA